MRSLTLARYLTRPHLRRYRTALAITAITLGLVAYALVAIADQSANAANRADGLASPALRTIEIESFGANDDPRPLTISEVESLSHKEGVTGSAVFDVVQVAPISPNPEGVFDTIVVGVAPRYLPIQPPLKSGKEPAGPQEVVLPVALAESAGLGVGDTLTVEHIVVSDSGDREGVDLELAVVGLFDDQVKGLDDALTIYSTTDTVVGLLADESGKPASWVEERHVFPRAFLTVEELKDVDGTVGALRTEGFGATSVTTLLAGASPTLRFLDALAPVVWVIAGAMTVALAWSIATSIMTSRRPEVGALRAIGWRRAEVRSSFAMQMATLGLMVGVTAAALFLVLAAVLAVLSGIQEGGLLAWAPGPSAAWAISALSLPLLASVAFALASLPIVERLARMPADAVLRDTRE
ncbi:ABC transporter permease [Demequina oxidasica]|uniref:ABC transporter permease n=1 Tax=Demequina oxidasica TaxID=676199 RepID=UPI000785406A|nr:ABC transporter permease [Demequina oxidasica]